MRNHIQTWALFTGLFSFYTACSFHAAPTELSTTEVEQATLLEVLEGDWIQHSPDGTITRTHRFEVLDEEKGLLRVVHDTHHNQLNHWLSGEPKEEREQWYELGVVGRTDDQLHVVEAWKGEVFIEDESTVIQFASHHVLTYGEHGQFHRVGHAPSPSQKAVPSLSPWYQSLFALNNTWTMDVHYTYDRRRSGEEPVSKTVDIRVECRVERVQGLLDPESQKIPQMIWASQTACETPSSPEHGWVADMLNASWLATEDSLSAPGVSEEPLIQSEPTATDVGWEGDEYSYDHEIERCTEAPHAVRELSFCTEGVWCAHIREVPDNDVTDFVVCFANDVGVVGFWMETDTWWYGETIELTAERVQ